MNRTTARRVAGLVALSTFGLGPVVGCADNGPANPGPTSTSPSPTTTMTSPPGALKTPPKTTENPQSSGAPGG